MTDTAQQLANNKTLARDYIHALGTFDADKTRMFMHDQFEAHIPAITMRPDRFSGEGLLTYLQGLTAYLPAGITFTISHVTAEDNRVSVVAKGNASTLEGKPYNNHYHLLLTIEDGKIIHHMEFMDSFLGAKVLGPLMQKS